MFWELHKCARKILNPVILGDLEGPVSTPPDTMLTKGRHKKDSTKMDKLHWEHIKVASRASFKSSSRSGSESGFGLGNQERGRMPRAPRARGRGRGHNRGCYLELSSDSSIAYPSVGMSCPLF